MKRIVIWSLVLLLLLGSICPAAAFEELSSEGTARRYTITGISSKPGEDVSLLLTEQGVTLADCAEDPSKILYLRQTTSGTDGSFTFRLQMDIEEDLAVQAYLNVLGGEPEDGLTFLLPAEGEEEGLPEGIRLSGTRLTVSGSTDSGKKDRQLVITLTRDGMNMNHMKKGDLVAFAQLVTGDNGAYYKAFPLNTAFYDSGFYLLRIREKGQPTKEILMELFGEAELDGALAEINAAASAEELAAAFTDNRRMAGCDDIIDHADFETVCEFMIEDRPDGGYADLDTAIDALAEQFSSYTGQTAALSEINAAAKAGRWADLEVLIGETYAEVLGISEEDLEKIEDAKSFYRRLTGQTYQSLADVTDAFDQVIAELEAEQEEDDDDNCGSSSSSGGGGGGGGGGSISSVKVTVDPVTIETPAQPALEEAKLPSAPFTDLASVPWAKEAIDYLRVNGIVHGGGDGSFRPDEAITREEFVKLLVGAFAVENGGSISFSDVPADSWFYEYVASAFHAGIVQGRPDGTFGAGEQISRADMTVMSYRGAAAKGIALVPVRPAVVFADFISFPDYAVQMIGAMQEAGIVNGAEDDLFKPLDSATRAEAAKLIYELMKLL